MVDHPSFNDLTRASREAYGRYPMPTQYPGPGGLLGAMASHAKEKNRREIAAAAAATAAATAAAIAAKAVSEVSKAGDE